MTGLALTAVAVVAAGLLLWAVVFIPAVLVYKRIELSRSPEEQAIRRTRELLRSTR